MNGAEKDSERKNTVTAVAVVSREVAFSLSPLLRPLRASANPQLPKNLGILHAPWLKLLLINSKFFICLNS